MTGSRRDGGSAGEMGGYLRRVIELCRGVTPCGGARVRILPLSVLVSDNVRSRFVPAWRTRVGPRTGWHAYEVLKDLPGHRVLSQNGAYGHGEHRNSLLSVSQGAGADQGGGADGS